MIKSHLKIIVLKILSTKKMSGYDLAKEIEQTTQYWKPSFGSIYPMLKDLNSKGLIDVETIGRRKVYHVTELGKKTIKDILKTKEEIFNLALSNIKNLEMICNKREIAYIRKLHNGLKTTFLPFKGLTKEMNEINQEVMKLNDAKMEEKKIRGIKKILQDAINNIKKVARS